MMRAISLWNPWGVAMVTRRRCGRKFVKRYETRSWKPDAGAIGTRFAIATAKTQKDTETKLPLKNAWLELVIRRPEVSELFAAVGFTDWADLPFGFVLGHAELVRAVPTSELLARGEVDELEFSFGDYSAGRWAWEFADMTPLAVPVPVRGKQGIFLWDEKEAA